MQSVRMQRAADAVAKVEGGHMKGYVASVRVGQY